ncbi:MAG: FG-GAP repeat protein [Crocinitomicaceae bacterium]|nr:FG-GAP repeat protein [Crocinitomicaceae bacterium]
MKAVPADRASDDQFGYAVDIDGNFAIVGAFSDNFGGSENHGSVYIYKRNGINDWTQHQKLIPNDQEDYDRFGWSVSIDGDYAIVGAYREDEDASGNNSLSNSGSAYIFENDGTGNWIQVEKLVASDRQDDDEFGWSVSIHGTTAIVGARAEDHNVAGGSYIYSAGSVYIFDRDGSGNWNQSQKICAADRAADINYPGGYSGEDLGDQFGWAVSIWGDYLVVGALHHDYAVVSPPSGILWSSGAAYIFERSGGIWTQVQKIQNFDRESWDRFGCAVDIDTNVVVVGAYSEDEIEDGVSGTLTNPGSAYLYERNVGGTWNFTQKIVPDDRNSGDHFGYSFALEDTLLVIGTHSDDHDENDANLKDDAGSAYIFEKNAGVWSQYQKIDASDRDTLDEFGISVGLSGHVIVIGAFMQDFDATNSNEMPDAGAAYFFSNQNCPVLITDQNINLCFGESLTVGSSVYTIAGSYSDLLISYEGCDSTVNTILTFEPEISSSTDVAVCFGTGYWIDGVYQTVPGNYPVNYTAQNGCDSTAYINLTIEDEITATQNVSICFGDSYTIGTNTYSTSGVYTDVITASNFCDSVVTTNLTVQLPVNNSIDQNNNILTAVNSSATYQWIICNTGLPIAGATNQVYIAPVTGLYAVIVTENGCTDTSACVLVDIINGVSEFEVNAVTIFPNPNQGEFQIILNNPDVKLENLSLF